MTLEELQERFSPNYRAVQIFDWLQVKGITSWSEASDLPKEMRGHLETQYPIYSCSIEKKQVSMDGTVKYLFRLRDGEFVESVLLKYEHGYSLCVSSQAGCNRGCLFCSSTIGGLQRDLLPSEIIRQIHAAQKDGGHRISHVVMMGMGEPLDNLDNVLRFLELAVHPKGLNLSSRNISLSTCGVVPGIKRLGERRMGVTLSVSLHAPNDELRSLLMPVNRQYPLSELIQVCRQYAKQTSRRISFEYTMLHQINDTPAQARELAKLLRGMLSHVNLIPVNPSARG